MTQGAEIYTITIALESIQSNLIAGLWKIVVQVGSRNVAKLMNERIGNLELHKYNSGDGGLGCYAELIQDLQEVKCTSWL